MAELKICGICCGSICDRYLMRVADVFYHERCLLCSVCGIRLSHTCFTRDSKLYCRLDYDRLYAKKCLGCSERISADELVMKALDSVFHLRCFICVVCGVRLQRGDQFVIKQGQLFCRPDYEKEVEMLQGYAQGDFTCDDLLPSSRNQDGRRGPKRPRTILTTQQRKAFKASFEVSPKPCRKVREALAKDTGLSVRIVQVWFQNQRAKMKKIQKKARQENKSKDSDSGDDRKPKLKEEDSNEILSNKKRSLSRTVVSRGNLQHPRSKNQPNDTNTTLPTNENYLQGNSSSDDHLQYLPIKEELLDNDDSSFIKISSVFHAGQPYQRERKFIADGGHEKMNPGFLGFPYSDSTLEPAATAHQIFINQGPPPLGLNPIDRLYSMQTSYFCGEDTQMVDQ
ncbi:Insulin gene enhancer protein ISL-2, putative [Pediculus humanus corporis]|uniref:Insulin gene enhancer protein ISL-2, putative n=1 Tax=Pediculus humanus subsp. corporis TaxID=121224 RepID=E0VED1_PEDHC|nr:Insulin gene enhancer protein ISL-2, putative [Pediculus humanus corporis]EEB11737.1 Insulin gene enhancer protein ISL-2, putative [Pediculus humanus corporis]